MFTGANAALADHNEDGEPSNTHGLCTAYFNGQKKGHDKNGQPGPFAGLEAASRVYTEEDGVDNDQDGEVDEEGENQDLSAAENIFNYCSDHTEIGGNPTHGRFTCVEDGADSDPECTDNPDPSEGKGKKA